MDWILSSQDDQKDSSQEPQRNSAMNHTQNSMGSVETSSNLHTSQNGYSSLAFGALPVRLQPSTDYFLARGSSTSTDIEFSDYHGLSLPDNAEYSDSEMSNPYLSRQLDGELPDHSSAAEVSSAGNRNASLPARNRSLLSTSTLVSTEITQKKCGICLETFTGLDLTTNFFHNCRRCPDTFCNDCLKDWFIDSCRNESKMPPKCCKIILLPVMEPLLQHEQIELFKAKFEEWVTRDRTYCPVPTCSAFIPPRFLELQSCSTTIMKCPQCSCSICRMCLQLSHLGECLPTIDIQLEAKLQTWNIKRCPGCQNGVRRMFGCNHIQCRCGLHFCWRCVTALGDCICFDAGEDSDDEFFGNEDDDSMSDDDEEDQVPGEAGENEGFHEDDHNTDPNGDNLEEHAEDSHYDDVSEGGDGNENPTDEARRNTIIRAAGRYFNAFLDDDLDAGFAALDGEDGRFGNEPNLHFVDPRTCAHTWHPASMQTYEGVEMSCQRCWIKIMCAREDALREKMAWECGKCSWVSCVNCRH
jgi:hypothetical protein